MGFQQHTAAIDVVWVQRGAHAQVGHPRQRLGREAMHKHRKDAAGGGFPVREPQVQGAKTVARTGGRGAQLAAQLAAMHHMAADGVGPPQQAGCCFHVACGQGLAHGGTRYPQPMHLVAVHARYVKTFGLPGSVQHGVVARALAAKAEIVAHQHVAGAQAAHQYLVDESVGRLGGQPGVKRQHHGLLHTAACQLGQLVAQRAHARGGEFRLAVNPGKVVPRVRLERQHAAFHPPVRGLAVEQGQHGLVAPVHAIEIADGQRTGIGNARVVEAAKDLHRFVIFLIAPCAGPSSAGRQFVMKTEYIVTHGWPRAGLPARHLRSESFRTCANRDATTAFSSGRTTCQSPVLRKSCPCVLCVPGGVF